MLILNNNKKISYKIHGFLFITEFGDYLFISSIAIYLLSCGYSALLTSTYIALTVIPNILFARFIGNVTDRVNHSILILLTGVLLSIAEVLLLICTGWFMLQPINSIVPIIFLGLAILYAPYRLCIWHYMVPLLTNNESSAYSQAEITSCLAAFIASLSASFALLYINPGWLILIDSLTFLCSSIFISIFMKAKSTCIKSTKKNNLKLKSVYDAIVRNHILLVVIIGIYLFAFTIEALIQNLIPLGVKSLDIKATHLAGLVAFGTFFELLGSVVWNRSKQYVRYSSFQILLALLVLFSILLIFFFVGIYTLNFTILTVVIATIFFILPIWNVNSTLELRRQIPKGYYGTYLSVIRVPRAIITLLGITLMALMIDMGYIGFYLLCLSIVLFIIASYIRLIYN